MLEGQRVFINISDPLGRDWDLVGTAGRNIDTSIADHPGLIALVQVAAVIAGHIVAAVAAHDTALADLPQPVAVRSPVLPLAVMVGYTVTALLLLFTECGSTAHAVGRRQPHAGGSRSTSPG